MDDKEKSVIEQIADKLNDVVENIANTASEALDTPTQPPGQKPKRQSVPDYEFPSSAAAGGIEAGKASRDAKIKTGKRPASKRPQSKRPQSKAPAKKSGET
jgi:hypothetical protein